MGSDEPGKRLRRIRERLQLRYRDVEASSEWIANQHGNNAFLVGISRLADIENKATVPSLYRLYSLCTIYRIEYHNALKWYGIMLDQLPAHAAHFAAQQTQPFDLETSQEATVTFPVELDDRFDFRNTDHLSRSVKHWGKLPIALFNGLDGLKHRYAFIGTEDWSMYPIIRPGSFIQLDERKKHVQRDGWTSEYDRPIYFIECHDGFKCGWCSHSGEYLVLQPHYASSQPATVYKYPGDVEVIGQVVAVVMRLSQATQRHTHS